MFRLMALSRFKPDIEEEADETAAVEAAPAVPAREIFRRFWPWTHPDRPWLVVGGVLLLAGTVLDIVAVWLFKFLVDEVLVPRDFAAFWPLAAALLAAAVLAGLVAFAGDYLAAWVAERFLLRLRNAVFRHLQGLTPDALDRRRRGDTISRLTTDIGGIEQLVASGVIDVVTSVISVVFFAGAALYLSWPLALVAFGVAPIFWFVSRYFGSRIQKVSREARRRDGAVSAVVEGSLAGSSLTQAYNQQTREIDRLHRAGLGSLRAELATARLSSLFPPLLNLVEVVGALLVVGLGAFQVSQGLLTLGGLLAFAAFLSQLYSPVRSLSQLAPTLSAAATSAERLIELLDARSPVSERPDARDLTHPRGHIVFHEVTFTYPTADHPVLAGLSFDVHPGQTLAIVGPSGAGKSTVAKLLLRFYDPSAGSIALDGVDLRDLTFASLRGAVTLLPQETHLFHGSVRDNIAYARPDATDDAIRAAAETADAHGFISAFPDGYDTMVGERGHLLSGGQRQRIAIARALLRDAPVLVLDELTAGLDAPAVRRIIEPLRRLMAGRTTILITHDLTLARDADTILTFHADHAPVQSAPLEALGEGIHGRPPDGHLLGQRHGPVSGPSPTPPDRDAAPSSSARTRQE